MNPPDLFDEKLEKKSDSQTKINAKIYLNIKFTV